MLDVKVFNFMFGIFSGCTFVWHSNKIKLRSLSVKSCLRQPTPSYNVILGPYVSISYFQYPDPKKEKHNFDQINLTSQYFEFEYKINWSVKRMLV